MKYRKKPVVIDAVKWTGTNMYEIIEFSGGSDAFGFKDDKCSISTLEGTMTADVGDYIIMGVKGEFYPCKPDIFHSTYDIVV